MTFYSLVLVFILFLLPCIYFLKNYKERKRFEVIDKLPGPKRLPLIGTSLDLLKCPRRGM